MDFAAVGSQLVTFTADRAALVRNISTTKGQLEEVSRGIQKNEESQELITKSMQMMYSNLSSQLGDIATECLLLVFPDSNYTQFMIEFVQRRDTVEADLYLVDVHGYKYHPVDAVGGGVADLLSLMLRISYIVLSEYDNFLLADEPLKFIDRERLPETAEFIKKVCKDLNFKLIMITHIPELISVADTVYRVKKVRKVSVTENVTKSVKAYKYDKNRS